jgi:chitinase
MHDAFGGAAKKRSLVSEAQQYEILQGRATDCTLANWERLLAYATLMFSASQVGFDGIRSIWNNDLAGSLDEQYEFPQLEDYFFDYPWFDRRAYLEYILLNPLSAGQGMRDTRTAGSELCRLESTTKRDLTKRSSEKIKREIWVLTGDANGTPRIITIFNGIRDGHLSLHYARWQWVGGEASNAPEGPLLELAYWIGPNPGVDTTGNTFYDQYRDMRGRGASFGPDRWVGKYYNVLNRNKC